MDDERIRMDLELFNLAVHIQRRMRFAPAQRGDLPRPLYECIVPRPLTPVDVALLDRLCSLCYDMPGEEAELTDALLDLAGQTWHRLPSPGDRPPG